MKSCLIAGQYGILQQILTERFVKEGWQVSTMSQSSSAPPHIFQHYTTDCGPESIRSNLDSCKPEVLVCMGAYDYDFFGRDSNQSSRQQYLSYISGLLMQAGQHGVRKVIYLSSDDVFDDSYAMDITEEMAATAGSALGVLLRQGEMIARDYADSAMMDVTILRLAKLYAVPLTANDCSGRMMSICLQTILGHPVEIDPHCSYNGIGVRDAVEAVYLVCRANEHSRVLYHVASPLIISDNDILNEVKQVHPQPIELKDCGSGYEVRRVLNAQYFCAQFSFNPRTSFQDTVHGIMTKIQSEMNLFTDSTDAKKARGKSKLYHSGIAALETALSVLLCFFLTQLTQGSAMLSQINLYLLCSLLFALFYGTKIGILASVLSTLCYLFGLSGTMGGFELLVDVGVYIWIIQLFIVSLSVGFVRDTLNHTRESVSGEIDFLTNRLQDVERINSSNVRIKDFFENNMVDSSESIGYIYKIISVLDNAKRTSVMFQATKILMELMGTRDVAIYRVLPNGFCRLTSSNSESSRRLGKSIRCDDYADFFRQIREKYQYVNRSMTPNLPSMAGVISTPDNDVSFVVMLWDVDFVHMTLYYVNMLRVICHLISNAVTRSAEFLEAVQSSRVMEGTIIMQPEPFRDICQSFSQARSEGLADYTLLEIKDCALSYKELSDLLQRSLRFTDAIGVSGSGTVQILLNNTSTQDAMFVLRRLTVSGLHCEIVYGTDTNETPA